MPSEKSRYMLRNLEPEAPLDFDELRTELSTLGARHLAELLWLRAQYDDILRKSATVSIVLRLSKGDWDKAKKAIDYALHFPDYVRYTEDGHGLIIEEIKSALDVLAAQNQAEFALQIAQYAVEVGQKVADNFEDDWEWTSSLEDLVEWIVETTSKKD